MPDLNKIICGPLIWDVHRFAGVRLRSETRWLLAVEPRDEELVKVNRLLLEDAYPSEITRKRDTSYQIAFERNRTFVQGLNKTLIPVETNYFPFGYRYNFSRGLTQGGALVGVALLLGFSRAFIPASFSYNNLIPNGSHPLTDPLWSNETVSITHDSAGTRRVDKVIKIAECEAALANLRVCLKDMNTNCGKCVKCMRTMVSLQLAGKTSGPFPPFPSPAALKKVGVASEHEKIFFEENYELAVRTGHRKLRIALAAGLRRYARHKLWTEFDRLFLGGRLKQAYRKHKKATAEIYRIVTSPEEGSGSRYSNYHISP